MLNSASNGFLASPRRPKVFDNYKAVIESSIEIWLMSFAKQTEVDEISLLIGDADTLTRLRITATIHY